MIEILRFYCICSTFVCRNWLNPDDKNPQTKKCLVYELTERSKLSSHLNKYQKNMLNEEDESAAKSWDCNEYICYKAPNNLTLLFTDNFDSKRAEVIATSYCSMDKM